MKTYGTEAYATADLFLMHPSELHLVFFLSLQIPMLLCGPGAPPDNDLETMFRTSSGYSIPLSAADQNWAEMEFPIVVVHNGDNHFAATRYCYKEQLNEFRMALMHKHMQEAVLIGENIDPECLPGDFCNFFNHLIKFLRQTQFRMGKLCQRFLMSPAGQMLPSQHIKGWAGDSPT